MFCSTCGERLTETARFCPRCGSPVPGQLDGSETPEQRGEICVLPHDPEGSMRTVETAYGKRSETLLMCRCRPEDALSAAELVLSRNGFSRKDYRGEPVWKKGTGLLTAMQYAKLVPSGNCLLVQGWVQIGVGDAGLKEQCLTGMLGAIPKKMLLGVIDQIRAAV